ncbi:MAG: HAD-IA family hydrolase [Anaerolineaceae bacterium]|nr:HAD-IA family hydrolase [Anaerolineaceae bacterium]
MQLNHTMIKCLIFDFDGLILDTETPTYAAWQEIFKSRGCELTLEKWSFSIGSNFQAFNPVTELGLQLQSVLDTTAILAEQRQRSIELLAAEDVMPGIRETIQTAHKYGLKVALASSSDKEWIKTNLTRLELITQFDCIRTADDVCEVKPAPDLFLSALECLGLQHHEAIVFEDSLNGILAARAAGIFSVAVPNRMTMHMDLDHANLILKSVNELSLVELLNLADQAQI